MKQVVFVGCSSAKLRHAAAARDLYQSKRFRAASEYAESNSDSWFILSGKHGVLRPDQVVEPYDLALASCDESYRARWNEEVAHACYETVSSTDRVTILADPTYARPVIQSAARRGRRVVRPFEGRSEASILNWLRAVNGASQAGAEVQRFYELMNRLETAIGGPFLLGDEATGENWPSRGVYFLYEEDQRRLVRPFSFRMVRVGTHAVSAGSTSALWGRVRTHRGTSDGLGNHRSSVMRLHIGSAIRARNPRFAQIHSWGRESSRNQAELTQELALERVVSDYIRGMRVSYLPVLDAPGPSSDRAFIEQNSLALLTGPGSPYDVPDDDWLGRWCPKPSVRRSGLWNVDYVGQPYDSRLMAVLEHYVRLTESGVSPTRDSVAPKGWHEAGFMKSLGQTTLPGVNDSDS